MNEQSWIIFGILFVANISLIFSEVIKRMTKKKDIDELRRKKKAEMIDRASADFIEFFTDEDLEDEIEPKQIYIWILGIVVCLDIWILGAVVTHWWAANYFADNEKIIPDVSCLGTSENNATTRGLFGDSFGAVNSLISAFAFAGMIVAFILQRYELRLQRKELGDSRKEMRRQTTQFKTQNANLELQRFENTFFNMLDLHKQNLQEINLQGVQGREAFPVLLDILKRIYFAVDQATSQISQNSLEGVLGSSYAHELLVAWGPSKVREFAFKYAYGLFFYGEEFHFSHDKGDETRIIEAAVWKLKEDDLLDAYHLILNSRRQGVSAELGHYYRHIFQMVCMVDHQSKMKPEVKYVYVKMLRAQLSDYEQILFYYNSLSFMGYDWHQKGDDGLSLITRYRLVKNIPHFYTYFYTDPRVQFKEDIVRWKQLHSEEHFFEQLSSFE